MVLLYSCHSLSGGPGSIKKEEEEASSQDESQGTESEEGETSHNDTPRARGRKRKRKRYVCILSPPEVRPPLHRSTPISVDLS